MTNHAPSPASATPADDGFLRVLGALAATGAMTVHNARGGFACNSSSSHSIVIVPAGVSLTNTDDCGGDYGQADFVLTDTSEKVRYLAAMLGNTPAGHRARAGLAERYAFTSHRDDNVDHQSRMSFPENVCGDDFSLEFLHDFAAFLADPRVAVLGGSDSDDSPHWQDGMLSVAVRDFEGWRARKDTDPATGQSWWVLFNALDGTKVRITFDLDVIAAPTQSMYRAGDSEWEWLSDTHRTSRGMVIAPTKAPVPELVDVKLTDRCPFELDCGFCYMGSTRKSPEGDPAQIAALLTSLADLGVFEIAFGGGEPTTWKHFEATLEYARSVGLIPNFTTKNYAWLAQDRATDWLSLVGAVAFSVNTAKAMDTLTAKAEPLRAREGREIDRKITVQLIPDLVPLEDFRYILRQAAVRDWRVTLLGYKEVGRGATFTPAYRREPGWWIAECQDVHAAGHRRAVAIDTALALDSAAALTEAGVPKWMYHVEEGRFSAYVDAVTGRMGPSSYCDPSELVDLDLSAPVEDITAAFTATFATF